MIDIVEYAKTFNAMWGRERHSSWTANETTLISVNLAFNNDPIPHILTATSEDFDSPISEKLKAEGTTPKEAQILLKEKFGQNAQLITMKNFDVENYLRQIPGFELEMEYVLLPANTPIL